MRSTNNSIHGKAKWSSQSINSVVVRHKLKVAMQFGARKWMDFTYSECCCLSIDEAILAQEQCAQLNVEVLPKILLHVNFNMNILNGITSHCRRFEFHALNAHTHVQFVRISFGNKGECVRYQDKIATHLIECYPQYKSNFLWKFGVLNIRESFNILLFLWNNILDAHFVEPFDTATMFAGILLPICSKFLI